MSAPTPQPAALAARVVIPSFFAQNLAFALSQGSFGPLLQSNAAHFGVTPSAMVFCASALNLSLALAAPVVSLVMDRLSVRRTMIAGSLISAGAYYGLFASNAFPVALAMYFALGVGCAILGVLAPLALVNRWLADRRGKVLGWINAPVILPMIPLLIGAFIGDIGRGGLLLAAAVIQLATIPLFLMVPADRDRNIPEAETAQSSAPTPTQSPASRDASTGTVRELLRSSSFWTIALAISVIAGMSSAFIVNVVSLGTERGLSFQAAAGLVSVFAASGALGSIVLGWLCDRIGAVPTVAISAAAQALTCIALIFAHGSFLFTLTAIMGIFAVPILTLMGAAISQTIAAHLVGRAIGAIYFVKLPFIFAFAPLFELLSHVGARFALPFALLAIALGLVAAALLLQRRLAGVPRLQAGACSAAAE